MQTRQRPKEEGGYSYGGGAEENGEKSGGGDGFHPPSPRHQ